MIINNAPQNEAIMSNVSEIGEFRIRNSAKAFSILSSGLYANKIKAIIRELSCNAVDSHVAAGKQDTPFDVHLPNSLEPWFSIRDYGTGLSHEQVTQIYTTYFESTKTNSNEFIGALGLGSKSPFAYTDNFTVTAIQSNKKGIYSAFINEAGVPSIALMMSEETDEPAGVEVKFSVNDRYDFDKFRTEAQRVYKWFKHQPVISGYNDFSIEPVEYETENIIPGVHAAKRIGYHSIAIMGNIAYPIEIPNSDTSLGNLSELLGCSLVMEFGIGELDFQASREGLSYIPQTINSIKAKLESLNAVLAVHVADEANKISNLWERALYLIDKRSNALWSAAVSKYVKDNDFKLISDTNNYIRIENPKMKIEDLSAKYNVIIRAFEKNRSAAAASNLKPFREQSKTTTPSGGFVTYEMWEFSITKGTKFIINDTKVGALERAKFHFRELHKTQSGYHSDTVYVIEAFDKTKPINQKGFFKAISNPPSSYVMLASTLTEKERTSSGTLAKNVTIMRLEEKGYGGYYRQKDMVWRDAGKASSFDAAKTYYYIPLSGFNVESAVGLQNIKEFAEDLKDCGIAALNIGSVYGVRKGDIEFIKTQSNWINIEEFVSKNLATIDPSIVKFFIRNELDNYTFIRYNEAIVKQVNAKSPYAILVNEFKDVDQNKKIDKYSLTRLIKRYSPKTTFDPNAELDKYKSECNAVSQRYPLLNCVRYGENEAVAEYINLIDSSKGI